MADSRDADPHAADRALDAAHHLHPFTDQRILREEGGPTVFVRGQGSTLYDANGRSYLDAFAGLWCVNVGYGRAELAEVAARQMRDLAFYNTFFNSTTPPTARLAAKLVDLTPDGLNHVLFANSGSEVLDSACRLARAFWALEGRPEKRLLIGREEGYHGSTMAGVSLGEIKAMHALGGLPLDGFAHVMAPYRFRHAPRLNPKVFGREAADAIEKKILELGADTVAAVAIEPVQGAGGVIIPPEGYLARVQEICRRNEVLLILDEVVTAFGRIGAWTAAEKYGLAPDFLALAKGLSSGYQPISALMVGDRVANTLVEKGGGLAHGFTYSGHPVAAAVALENLAILEREQIVERVRDDLAPYFAEKLAPLADHPLVGEVRTEGLLAAIELVSSKEPRVLFEPEGLVAGVVRGQMEERGVIVRPVRDAVLIAPTLVVTHGEIDRIVAALALSLDAVAKELSVIAEEQAIQSSIDRGRALAGRVCLVTGAGQGIGAAVAERFAAEGAQVILCARSADRLTAVADRIRAAGGAAIPLPLDLADDRAVAGLGQKIADRIGRLDALVLNHGVLGPLAPMPGIADTDFDAVIATNLTACARLIQELDPLLRAGPAGRVVTVSSGAAEGGFATWGAYGASKAGLDALARAYAAETAETDLRVNIIDPGEVRTEMRAAAFPDEDPRNLAAPTDVTDAFVRLASVACTLSGARVPALPPTR